MTLYNRGVELAEKGQLDEAIANFQKALELKPDFPEALNELGLALADKGQFDNAIAAYQKALQIKPNYPKALTNLSAAYYHKGEREKAIIYAQKAVQLEPESPEVLVNLGNALQAKGELDDAIAAFQKAIRIKPEFPLALNNLGNAHLDRGELDKAIARYREALQLKPDDPVTLNNIGAALHRKGQLDDAIATYRKALELKPNYAEAHYNLALALQKKGDHKAARPEFQEAQRLNPNLKPPAPQTTLPMADDFSGDCAWPRGETEIFSFGCEQGAYRMRLQKRGPVHITRNFGWGVQAVNVEVDATVASGRGTEPGAALLGIGCLSDENHGYLTILKTDGAWAIMRLENGFIQLAGTNEAGGIPGLGRTNRLRVVCASRSGKTTVVNFFVNGQKVGSVENKQGYDSFNGAALYADTFPGVVGFERFVARQPLD